MVFDKKQKILVISFIIVILITGILLLWYFDVIQTSSFKPQANPLDHEPIDFSVLESDKLKQLKGEIQDIKIGETGRENPFEPF